MEMRGEIIERGDSDIIDQFDEDLAERQAQASFNHMSDSEDKVISNGHVQHPPEAGGPDQDDVEQQDDRQGQGAVHEQHHGVAEESGHGCHFKTSDCEDLFD